MNKYDSYKDSGIEWIGEIPSHWDVTRIKYQYQIGRGRVISNEDLVDNGIYPVYSSQTLNNGCLGFIDTYDFDDKLITWTTDGANAGTVFLREGKFNCTNVCGTLKAKSDEIIPEFYYYFLQYATQFYKRPDTNGAKIMNNEMAVILSLKLSSDEQTAIANYLDQKTSEINNLIAKKERLIQLLEEERTAIINQAVTKGLDTTVPMKDSGVDGLNFIPTSWKSCIGPPFRWRSGLR
jgi:type I restriction enzyme S subunit